MKIKAISLLVNDYAETIAFYTEKLGFELKDHYPEYHWITLKIPEQHDFEISLSLASVEEKELVGRQMGSHCLFIIEMENCNAIYEIYKNRGVVFTKQPEETGYGTFAELKDLYGNMILLRGTDGAKHI